MANLRPTRRQFGTAAAATLALSLAGCGDNGGDDADDEPADDEPADDGDANDTEPDTTDEDEPTLTITLENEDGEPVSQNVVVHVEIHDSPVTHSRGSDVIEDGQIVFEDLEEGDHTVVVESEDDEFEPVEEELTMGDDDEELTFELEGATPDGEADEGAAEDENGDGDDGDGEDGDGDEGNGEDDDGEDDE
ncbi:S-layer protein [Natrononativus amylolyticus]|uniref:S-layer protein n=1 Tax=Natrononativus amylolyticus TaxID=2963434 RepID=UPI0020CDE081|nr:S-layer protein [Natrononativus amylolyticus]